MIRPLDNERCNRGITFKPNKIMRKQINNLVIALAFVSTLGCLVGCVKQEREKSRQAQTATSTTTKEDKETIKQKQLAYLKENEQEIVDFMKAQNPKVESVQIYWDETQWGVSGWTIAAVDGYPGEYHSFGPPVSANLPAGRHIPNGV